MLGEILRFFTKLLYLLQETFLGLRRGGWLNWAAVSTLMVLLFLVGISLELSWGLDGTVQSLGSQVEISAYLKPGVKGSTIEKKVSQLPHVAEVTVIPRERAWQELLRNMGMEDKSAVEDQLGTNPLVDALRIQADSPSELNSLAGTLEKIKGIDAVFYSTQVVQQLAQLQDSLRVGSLTITGVLTLTTVAVITTTIRLIVIARRREIEVMQLVGATAAWIYLPFILQGFLFGLIGSAGALGLVLASQQLMQDLLVKLIALPFLQISQSTDPWSQLTLPVVLVGMGTLLGTTSSLIAVRKSTGR